MDDLDTWNFGEAVLRLAAEKLAEEWVKQHGAEVLALVRPETVATLVAAEAGAKIHETLQKKLPDKIVEVVRTEREVWQRGPLGGLRRL